jgi:Fe-S cluster biogenesis protein NfuA/nitrite reductase/ring-hydroxylating ferredoxin subunit
MSVSPPPDAKPLARSDGGDRAQRVQELLAQIEAHPDPIARELMQECLHSVLEIYGEGLERILSIIGNHSNFALRKELAEDSLVRGLLIIHDLHPLDLEARLRGALDKVRPYMESHGGNVELDRLENGVAYLRLQGHCKSCPSSAATLDLAIRQAISEACPDLERLEVEGVVPSPNQRFHLPANAPKWTVVGRREEVVTSDLNAMDVNGTRVLLCKLGDQLYAYRDSCPECNSPLDTGALDHDTLECPQGHRFDVRHAGAGLDHKEFHLDPFPLIAANGIVKVSTAS